MYVHIYINAMLRTYIGWYFKKKKKQIHMEYQFYGEFIELYTVAYQLNTRYKKR